MMFNHLKVHKMKKVISIVLIVLALSSSVLIALYHQEIRRGMFAASLFSGAEQFENFNRVHQLFPSVTMPASQNSFGFPIDESLSLPEEFTYEGEILRTDEFVNETDTSALLVIQNGSIRFEEYFLTGGVDVTWLSMSVAKSFAATLFGIAIEEGFIGGVEDLVTDYLPSLAGSAYDSVRIKDVLQMSSGASWNEDYSDPDSDINRFGRVLALGGSLEELAASMDREFEPGTYNRYNSMDTSVLGLILVKATGRPLADYMIEKLWNPLGAEHEAHWLIDDQGVEMSFFGLNATARDYAKIGELYRLGGKWNGQQLVPAKWVKDSVTPDGPHLMPGENPASDYELGYGYQWWVMDGEDGEFAAIGVYNQFIYVNPSKELVIVKLSANSDYGISEKESDNLEFHTIELFRAIGSHL